MEIYIGKNNSLCIERMLDNCTIILDYPHSLRKEIEGNDILLYSTDKYICNYSLKNGGITYGVYPPKKYILLKNLKFSYGGDKKSVFHCKDIKNNVIEMDTITTERDIKINKILL